MQKNHIRNILIILIVILVLELTVFNMNSYRVWNSDGSITFGKDDFKYIQTDEDITLIQISNVGKEIKTLHIEVENSENVEYQLLYTDATTTEFTGIPSKRYIDSLESSKYIATRLSRKK